MADDRKCNPQPTGLHRLAWAAGIIGLPLSHYWLAAKIEPFYSSIYCFLCWSYIFVADFAVYKLRGTSLLRDRPKEFLFLMAWSVPVWMLFEAVNLRIQNWYYVMAPWSFSLGMSYLIFAFGTVLPGIFETMELVVGLIEKLSPGGRIAGRPFTIHLWNVRIQWGIRVLMLVLLLGFPPFALECYALVNFLSLLRGGRNWELMAPENRERHGLPAWGVTASAVLVPMAMLVCLWAAAGNTVASVAAPVDHCFRRELGEAGINALRQRNATEGNQFLRLNERPPEIDAALYKRMRRIVTLGEWKGMGIRNALALEELRVTRLDELA